MTAIENKLLLLLLLHYFSDFLFNRSISRHYTELGEVSHRSSLRRSFGTAGTRFLHVCHPTNNHQRQHNEGINDCYAYEQTNVV